MVLTQLFPVFSLHQCLQRTIKSKWKQMSISNQHIWVPRWCVFNFGQVPFWCMLGRPSNNAVKAEFQCKKYNFSTTTKNLFTTWIWTHDLLNASQLHYPLSYLRCGFQWNVARVFSTSSSSSCRMQADHHINSRWQTWSKRIMCLWCYAVDMLMLAVPGELSAWQTDRQTDKRFSALSYSTVVLYVYRDH